MSVFLAQMSQAWYRDTSGERSAKAAALHENTLRVFIDPNSSESSPAIDEGTSSPGSEYGGPPSPEGERPEDAGKCVRQHLHLLKLAVERLGNWPKDYGEYERLNLALPHAFSNDLKGVEGMDSGI
ncbi:hypothetical protein TSTA_091220 [Talaromyces stipitatus ATCC 10500]|uniref:Uncharacterized protein n=1 Tax=Talaromyces stipitatus (strain ATCC 10500 / CBS 375.48 / QM 6759 / NRRL 1006) TaxID=441959 RepID=B8M1I5_TALSN|nr:uncharacterized protein TSTA_091220 [Talaromyces stipitatus ATCC 10500]EED21881.1 hypothetical protein TSTA_091220 [Talaromyces stipitatus ATCC 10500]